MKKDLKNVKVGIEEIFSFLDNLSGLKHRNDIKQDIKNFSERTQRSEIPLTVLNNLIVNWAAGSGEIGKEIAKFFVMSGADAILDDQSGSEQWLVVFNPKIIKKYEVVKNVPIEQYMLPKIS